MLKISRLSVNYAEAGGAMVSALRGVDLEVCAGEALGILGESGAGKSSLGLAVMRLLPSQALVTSGSVYFHDADLLRMEADALRRIRGRRISLVHQEPALALNPVLTAGSQISGVLKAHRPVSGAEARREVASVLELAGLRDPERIARSYPHQLSGGERQRVALAQAIVCRPELLIADEPLSALDLVTQAEILDLLRRLQQELGLAVLMITHNAGVLRSMAARVVVMRQGEVIERGSLPELRMSRDPYVRQLMEPAGDLKPAGAVVEAGAAPLLSVDNLGKTFTRRRLFARSHSGLRALDHVGFSLSRGSATALIGRSGSGKSTLARCIAGFESPDEGAVLLEGSRIRPVSAHHAQPAQMVFQDAGTSLNPGMTAEQIVAEPLEIARWETGPARRDRVRALMEEAGLDADASGRRAAQFSGGQRQRLAIARALAAKPRLLVLDESFSGLDLARQAQMLRLLMQLQSAHGLTCLYISHDLNFVSLFAQRVLVMHEGKLVESLAPGQGAAARHSETRALFAAARLLEAPGIGASA